MPIGNPASLGQSIGGATGGAAKPMGPTHATTPTGTGSALSSFATGIVAGTDTTWHRVVLWFLGGVALIALAEPAPQIATVLVLLIILGVLLQNWPIYKTYLGLK
jgi:hypothetical protein